MKKIYGYIGIIAAFCLCFAPYLFGEKTVSQQIEEKRSEVIEIVRQIAEDATKGELPSKTQMERLKHLHAYIPRRYKDLKKILKTLPA